MKTFFYEYAILLMGLLQNVLPQTVDYDGPVTMTIFYDLGSQNWTELGQTTIYNLSPGKMAVPRSTLSKLAKEAQDGNNVLRLKTLMQASDHPDLEFYMFLKSPCSVLNSPITLYINLDHAGDIVGSSAISTATCHDKEDLERPSNFEFNYFFRAPESGPMPDTASYINRLDKEREAKEKGTTQDNRSFLVKYWMYIVPVALFVLISGSANSDAPAPTGR
ncbi:ER membrane protein complex subunit 10 [Nesidiocoris tenuis]|uniref:ER membrane protein complex subunit 10 n=1 Tax=Nesidiocoris tenuis TaxID=355587 RepID=A0ABN7AGL8_9HEMI|nr:ER membrane protein complex subunit 10 [Nesidiocoris tenuis]